MTWRAAATLAAAIASASHAALQGGPAVPDFRPAGVAGHLYVNAATGERTLVPGPGPRSGGVIWDNSDNGCGLMLVQDDPARDPAGGVDPLGTMAVHWGDIGGIGFIDGYEVGYATDIGDDTAGSGISGLGLINVFIDSYDGAVDPGGAMFAMPILGFFIEAIPGGGPGTELQGWIVTIDLEGSGYEFTFGASDLDGDGLHDFAYSYGFEQGQPGGDGVIGPMLARPLSLGGSGTATGCPDAFDWFNDGGDVYVGDFWFGGGDCSATPPRPYASFRLRLLGPEGGCSDPCCVLDFTDDGLVDFGDYLEFLNRYDVGDLSVDYTADGLVDFSDYLEFLALYDQCEV